MWVFTPFGFFSVVAHRDQPDALLVRARARADLSELVKRLPAPRPKVQRTPDADYAFRTVVKRKAWAKLMTDFADELDYDNFKNAVAARQGRARAHLYHRVWAELLELRDEELGQCGQV